MNWNAIAAPGSYADLYANYGDPRTSGFAGKYLVTNEHQIAGGAVVKVTSHVAIADRLHRVWADLVAGGHTGLIKSYDGCYVFRPVRGSSDRLSLHSWGLAIDVNAASFPLGSTSRQDPTLMKAFADAGFFWGGDFHNRMDPMHFQFTKPNSI